MGLKRWQAVLAGALSVVVVAHAPRDARACGGCFNVSQSRNPTQVTSHRMMLSISQQQTTLWDQIQYVGAPEEFAWVLPIRGAVDVGLSSDLLFSQLEALTAVTVKSPVVMCPVPSSGAGGLGGCSTSSKAATGGSGGTMGVQEGEENPVEVIAQEVVGPYETVQLASDDPLALRTWLETHGYDIPADIEPVIDAYVSEGFDFLALRLVPGTSVDAMRPVRVTTPGATPELPLRMVAAGTGAKTAVSLFVVGEGRYQPANMPFSRINETQLVWDFDQNRSNYAELRAAFFEQQNGLGWLKEAAFEIGVWALDPVLERAQNDPQGSGYGAANGDGAYGEALADVSTVFAGLDPSSLSLTRLNAELSREALEGDLLLGANPQIVSTTLVADDYVGSPCMSANADCSDPFGDGAGAGYGSGSDSGSGCDCSTAGKPDASIAIGAGVLLAGGAALRKRRRRKRA